MIYITSFKKEILQESWNLKQHQIEHSIGRGLLAYGLQEEYRLSREDILLEKGEYGKPYLKKYPEIFFNITHCKEMAACAIATKEIGIDIEGVRKFSPAILKRVLTLKEKEQLEGTKQKEEMFFRFWTLKESFIKAIGKGLSFPLQEISFQLPEEYEGEIKANQKGYIFYQRQINSQFILSICFKEREMPDSLKIFQDVPVSTFFNSFITN